jgi:hypothetical protein
MSGAAGAGDGGRCACPRVPGAPVASGGSSIPPSPRPATPVPELKGGQGQVEIALNGESLDLPPWPSRLPFFER